MNPSSLLISSRRLLQVEVAGGDITSVSAPTAAVVIPWSSSGSAKPFASSIALTLFVSFTALFFIGFLYAYIRRYIFADAAVAEAAADGKSHGLSASAIGSLPMVAYGKAGARRTTTDECTICLCEFDEKETIKIIPYCGHVFHPKCIDMWLAYHVTCPICRTEKIIDAATALDAEEVRLDVTANTGGAVAV